MDDKLDAQLSVAATVLIVVLLLGQVVLLAAHIWAPMARTADRLIVDENAPLGDEPELTDGGPPVADAEAASAGPWRWVALAISVLAIGLGLFAAWRVHQGSGERNRWLAVMVIAGLVVVWGVFTFRLIARSAMLFEGL